MIAQSFMASLSFFSYASILVRPSWLKRLYSPSSPFSLISSKGRRFLLVSSWLSFRVSLCGEHLSWQFILVFKHALSGVDEQWLISEIASAVQAYGSMFSQCLWVLLVNPQFALEKPSFSSLTSVSSSRLKSLDLVVALCLQSTLLFWWDR